MTSRTTLTEYLSRYNRGTKLLYPVETIEKQLEHYSQVDSTEIASALAERQFSLKIYHLTMGIAVFRINKVDKIERSIMK